MIVSESEETVDVEGGRFPLLLLKPEQPSGPVVIVLGEIWAVNLQIRGLCRRLAAAGFPVVAPDLYRGHGVPAWDASQEALTEAFAVFPDMRGVRDCRRLARQIAGGAFGLPGRRPCVWGFCMGGRFAHYLAAASSDVSRAVNFYGRLDFPLSTTKPFRPLDVSELIDVPYLGVFAEHDPLIPLSDVERLVSILRGRDLEHEVKVCEGTHHGFLNETRPAYNRVAAEAAWELALRFLSSAGACAG
jgi:carboxymethylenebutenolidase